MAQGTNKSERRETDRREGPAERRVSGVASRLRKGLWFEYHRKTEAGKFDILDSTVRTRQLLLEAFLPEVSRYEFSGHDSPRILAPSTILVTAIDAALERTGKLARRTAIVVVEEVARYLVSHYNIAMIDRRQTQRRQAATNS
jgi:hypothetical protein